MTVYSYNAQQLKKKTGPRKKFWSADKIAIAAGSFFVVSFAALVATAPAPVVTEAVATSKPEVKVNTNQLPSGVVVDGEGYMCTNQQTGYKFYTSDLSACTQSVTSYRCVIEDNWFVDTTNQVECVAKQKEHIADKNAEFNLDSYKEDYRNALSNLEQKNR
jgi:hypothetical protein